MRVAEVEEAGMKLAMVRWCGVILGKYPTSYLLDRFVVQSLCRHPDVQTS